MRNLKKVLSLALATLMMLSMMTVAFAVDNAADLTDLDDVTNTEAVSLLVDLGIINGKPNGSYAPTESVDRATMAKLICVMMMGNVDQTVFKGTKTDLSDVDGNWAEGYIKYCYANGIIAGRGNGKFDPSATVTVAEANKMLLVALGYKADKQHYTGISWAINVARDAQKAGLAENLTLASTATLNRDNAALVIFNSLFANEAYYSAVLYGDDAQLKPTTLGQSVYGLTKVTGVVSAVSATTTTITGTQAGIYDVAGTPSMVGNTVTFYTKNTITVAGGVATVGALKSVYSSAPVLGGKVLATSTNGTTVTLLTTVGGTKYVATLDASVAYYVNGLVKTIGTDGTPVGATYDYATLAALEAANVKVGTVVSFVDNDANGKADVVNLSNYTAAEVGTYSTTGDGSVTFSPAIAGTWTSKNVVGFAGIAKGDIVLATEYGTKLYVEKVSSVQGKVTKATSTGTYTVAGADYKLSGLMITGTALALSDEKVLYLDKSGYIVAVDGISTEKLPLAYVSAVDPVTMAGQQVKMVLTDGTAAVVMVSKLGGNPVVTTSNDVDTGKVYSYTVKDGKYLLTAVATTMLPAQGTSVGAAENITATITKGNATVVSGKYANASTIYVDVANGRSYTGYANVPTLTVTTSDDATDALTAAGGYYVANATNANLVDVVFLTNITSNASAASDKFVIYAATYSETKDADNVTIYTYKAIVGTEIKDIVVNATVKTAIGTTTGIYTASTKDVNGVITAVAGAPVAFSTKTNVEYCGGGILVYNTTSTISLTDSTVYFVIDTTKDTAEVSSIGNIEFYGAGDATNSDVIVVPNATTPTNASIVYIIK